MASNYCDEYYQKYLIRSIHLRYPKFAKEVCLDKAKASTSTFVCWSFISRHAPMLVQHTLEANWFIKPYEKNKPQEVFYGSDVLVRRTVDQTIRSTLRIVYKRNIVIVSKKKLFLWQSWLEIQGPPGTLPWTACINFQLYCMSCSQHKRKPACIINQLWFNWPLH